MNWKKSSAHPSQKKEFLGFIVDTLNLLVILTQMKVDKIISICTDLLEHKGCALRTLASLIGKLQNASTAILPVPLHFRLMQMANIRALAKEQQNYAANLILPESALSELRWWVRNLSTWNGKSFLNPDPELDIVITSDASLLGWGAEGLGQTTQGRWSQTEMLQHINVLELRAAELALKSFKDLWEGSRVRLRLDNTTAVSQIVKMGSPRSKRCLVVTKEIWEFVLLHGSMITAQHIPGKLNTIADSESQIFKDNSNWKLCPQVFQGLQKMFPWIEVDLFADRLNHQVPRFWSWRPDPLAEGVDALTVIWREMRAYAFPPFKLIHRVLRKVHNEGATLLLVAPCGANNLGIPCCGCW